jgi:malate dehydrogenase
LLRKIVSYLLNQSRLLPVAAYLQGEYGLEDVVIGVPCRLGCGGIESILVLTLTDEEREGLHTSARSVRQNIERSQEIIRNS